MKNLKYLMDHIRYQTFKIYFEYILKEHGQNTFNPSIETYANRTENKIMFKIKTGHYLELSTQDKITKDKNAENVTYLEMTEVLLIHCNAVKNSYQQNSKVLYTFVSNKLFGQLLDISPENFTLLKQNLI